MKISNQKDMQKETIKELPRWYHCVNEKCNRTDRMHKMTEKCDYDLTGKCEVCGLVMWERDREYSVFKFGRVVCAQHCGLAIFANKKNIQSVPALPF